MSRRSLAQLRDPQRRSPPALPAVLAAVDTLYVLGERNDTLVLQRLDARARRSTHRWALEVGRFEAFAH
ncbi:MAG: hypothetical protein ACI9KE_006488 [Polyangiales bacterium]|jgi:hypothetical protein